jgi:hypothetical protein
MFKNLTYSHKTCQTYFHTNTHFCQSHQTCICINGIFIFQNLLNLSAICQCLQTQLPVKFEFFSWTSLTTESFHFIVPVICTEIETFVLTLFLVVCIICLKLKKKNLEQNNLYFKLKLKVAGFFFCLKIQFWTLC